MLSIIKYNLMDRDLYVALFCIFSCFITSYLLAPFVKNIGERFRILDLPNSRKVHKKPIVRIGGISILIPFFVCLLFTKEIFNFDYLSSDYINSSSMLLIGTFLFFLVGIYDDIFKSPPLFRLAIQFLIAFFVSFNGLYFPDFYFHLPFIGEINIILSPLLSSIFSGIWIVSITNAINWLDGIDGLAAGFCFIFSICFLSLMFGNGNLLGILFFASLAGAILGFLLRNFKPAYYIMGDCGSNTLGFLLASSTLFFLDKTTIQKIPIYYLLLIFSLPIFDMCSVIFGRLLRSKSIFEADRSHIHHRLIDLNFKYSTLIFTLYTYSSFSVFLGVKSLNNLLS